MPLLLGKSLPTPRRYLHPRCDLAPVLNEAACRMLVRANHLSRNPSLLSDSNPNPRLQSKSISSGSVSSWRRATAGLHPLWNKLYKKLPAA